MAIIPDSFFGALARGDLLQVLLISILSGFAIACWARPASRSRDAIDKAAKMFFGIIRIIVRVAPIGAFGAMAFTVGAYGLGALRNLVALIGTFYLTSMLFVLIVLGAIARLSGFSILRFIAYIKDELLIVLGTSSSETVLPQMIQKMEHLGASRSVVGLVIPTGYSFNLDGTNIYMTLATLFLAQATNTHLTIWQELGILGVAMLTSKGASGVTGAGFITLAATLVDRARHSDPVDRDPGRHRQVHERVPRADQPDRQRRRLRRHQPLRRRARQGEAARDHGASDRDGRGAGAGRQRGLIGRATQPVVSRTGELARHASQQWRWVHRLIVYLSTRRAGGRASGICCRPMSLRRPSWRPARPCA